MAPKQPETMLFSPIFCGTKGTRDYSSWVEGARAHFTGFTNARAHFYGFVGARDHVFVVEGTRYPSFSSDPKEPETIFFRWKVPEPISLQKPAPSCLYRMSHDVFGLAIDSHTCFVPSVL